MSVHGLLRRRMFWSENTRIDKIADDMSRNRWEEIKSNLHFNNNDNMPYREDADRDKLFKIRPVSYTHLDVYKRQIMQFRT